MPKIVPEGAKRIHTVSFKVSQAEKDMIAHKAASRGLSPAEYLRGQAMQSELPPVVSIPVATHEVILSMHTLKDHLDKALSESLKLREKTAKGRNKTISKDECLGYLDWFAECVAFFKTGVAGQILMLDHHKGAQTKDRGLPKL